MDLGTPAPSSAGHCVRATQAGEVTDASAEDFRAGRADGGIHLAVTASGAEVVLTPSVVAEFGNVGNVGNGSLPKGWFVEAWKDGGKAETVGTALRVDGAKAGFADLFGSGRSLEFVATFHKRPHQLIGFGTDASADPCVTFSTKFGHGLYARSHFARPEETRLPASLLGSPHRFRIDWNFIEVAFWVDGDRLAHQLVPVVGYMRPMVSNASLGDDALLVEWLRMTPYAASGRLVSRVLDSGATVDWKACGWDADVPPGTAIAVEVCCGDTPVSSSGETPGWSPWQAVAEPGGAIGLRGRFARYRVALSTTDPGRTPSVRRVSLSYVPVDAPTQSRGSSSSGGGSIGT